MKKLFIAFSLLIAVAFTSNSAQAQQTATVGQLLTGLINVNVGAIQVDVELDNVLNDFTLVNVEDVLNDNNIEFLNNSINNNSVLSDIQITITNLLQNADILTENQVVVGVLSGGQLVIQDL